jgi:putative chitinase
MTPQTLVACTGARIDRASRFLPFITAAMTEFGIDTPRRQAAWLAQIGHESGGLHWLTELWGPTIAQRRYEPPGKKAADLGNTQPGDGIRFLGRGLLQVTGRANYRRCGAALGVDLEAFPQLLAEPGLASRSAAWFWASNHLNAYADNGDFTGLTRRINGGLTHLDQRIALWGAAKLALGVP